MPSQGPLYAAQVITAVDGSIDWVNPTNAQGAPDGSYATITMLPAGNSYRLLFRQYGFTIPLGSIILGVEFTVTRHQDLVGGASIDDLSVKAVKVNDQGGGAELSTGAAWAVPPGDESKVFGGPTNLCGFTWTAADINDATSGFFLKVTNSGGIGTGKGYCDAVGMTVYYSALPGHVLMASRQLHWAEIYE